LQEKATAAQSRAEGVAKMLAERKLVCAAMQREHYDMNMPRILEVRGSATGRRLVSHGPTGVCLQDKLFGCTWHGSCWFNCLQATACV